MAPVITRIIIFLFSLLIIVLLLAGAAKGEDNLRFRLLNSKEMIVEDNFVSMHLTKPEKVCKYALTDTGKMLTITLNA